MSEGENALVDLLEDLSKQQPKEYITVQECPRYKVFQALMLKVFLIWFLKNLRLNGQLFLRLTEVVHIVVLFVSGRGLTQSKNFSV